MESETTVVLDIQRIKFAKEFDDGIVNAIPGDIQYGVLFSGPNGRVNAFCTSDFCFRCG